ncbi:hypothetical protein G6N82_03410 [Altererythrobacter sp. BO-6]|nr:hypothetical protein G6N82_03410 [Altererythrobacter sp. BO-6]
MQTGTRTQSSAPRRYLFGPVRDFLTFGGSSLVLLPVVLALPADRFVATFAFAALLLAHVINHPHFAHSYQIFYRGFAKKAFAGSIGREMQLRYLFAGIVAPALLALFLVTAVAAGEVRTLGYAANAMALFVGWHYVKQGYGLLMVDCALKKRFFGDRDKKVLLVNSYAVWLSAWAYGNAKISKTSLWGIEYFTFAIPEWIVFVGIAIASITSALTLAVLVQGFRERGQLPWNGILAYFVSIYLWLAFVSVNPLWLLITPALHSLQYLAVVWRFETNYATALNAPASGTADEKGWNSSRNRVRLHILVFVMIGAVAGFIGFWGAPLLLTAAAEAPQKALGAGVFLFSAWVFINVHHYFMDNVMWRRNNPDTKLYLFG